MPGRSEITLPDEFASTMQSLVAEAEKAVATPLDSFSRSDADSARIHAGFVALNDRMTRLERWITSSLDKFASAGAPGQSEMVAQMKQIDDHMVALRGTESVNQRLFNSLHEELKNYRDDFLRESLQKPFIRDLVVLFDDLSSVAAQLETAGGSSPAKGQSLAHSRTNLENAIHSLTEILHRMEVNQIEPKDKVDRALHRVVSVEPAECAEEDGLIVMRTKRGFLWRDQVLRPEEVVAKRFG